jgi:hypothetical protein
MIVVGPAWRDGTVHQADPAVDHLQVVVDPLRDEVFGVQQQTQILTSRLDCNDALQACGMLHLSAALVAGTQADHDTAATHLAEASALAARLCPTVGLRSVISTGLF